MSHYVTDQRRPEVTCEITDFISNLDLPRENVPRWRLEQEAEMKQILETYADLVEAVGGGGTKRTPVKRKSPTQVRPITVTDDDLGLKRAKLMIDRPPASAPPMVHHYNTLPPSYSAARGEVNRARMLTSGGFISQPVENQQTLSFRPQLFQIPDPLSFPPFNVQTSQPNPSGLVVQTNKPLQRVRQCL